MDDLSDVCPEVKSDEPSLQQRFEAMRARKQAAAARVKAAEKARANGPRSAAAKAALREKFIAQAQRYIGTPYSEKRNPEVDAINSENGAATLFLDCCGLVRRILLDLKEDFGFEMICSAGREDGDLSRSLISPMRADSRARGLPGRTGSTKTSRSTA